MESVAPIPFGGFLFDLEVIGGPLIGGPASPTGTISVDHSHVNGGSFSGQLPVMANLIFTEAGNPTNKFTQSFFDIFTSLGVWSHTPRPDDVHTDEVLPFPAGFFYPGVDPDNGHKVLTPEQALWAAHGVLPAQTPLPPAAVLLGSGLAILLGYGRRRRSRKP